MAVVKVKGKTVFVDDKIVAEGDDMIRKALAGTFPDAPTMNFEVVGAEQSLARVTDRASAVIRSSSTAVTKG